MDFQTCTNLRLRCLIGDLSQLSTFVGTTVPCRSTVRALVPYFHLLARATEVTWSEALYSLRVEFPLKTSSVYGGPLGLEMVAELAKRCLLWTRKLDQATRKEVHVALESLLVAAVKSRCVLLALVVRQGHETGSTPAY